MTRMTGPDCVVMCNLINTHTHTKFDFTVDEGKERLNPSRENNKGTHRRRKVDEKSCVTPAGTPNEFDVQNKWEEKTQTHNTFRK